ncbi:H-NS family nucleoid-associated regulatory protein [Tardiphaga robiniae]|uniref:H-NS histone family protein n=1 Tax=Tardiphaga robiniae TaxID=943830 RepID=A0A7G6U8F0_9BRAD|nr:H-NS histone family protein [Tardiphaga robiniae]QND75282.1 H-NS histone family protein [Tardiphaga robiniae]
MSKKIDLEAMSVDELWKLHEELSGLLSARMTLEKRELEKRLAQLRREEHYAAPEELDLPGRAQPRARRAYPRVLPKYRNPENPNETWSGRGKQPRWIAAALDAGRQIDDMLITNGSKVAQASDNGHRR